MKNKNCCDSTLGNSMIPSIFPGAKLEIFDNLPSIVPGDVITFLDKNGSTVAHRVISITQDEPKLYTVSGDSAYLPEVLPQKAIIGVVKNVNYDHFSYNTKSLIGQFYAQMATSRKLRWRIAKRISKKVIKKIWIKSKK